MCVYIYMMRIHAIFHKDVNLPEGSGKNNPFLQIFP